MASGKPLTVITGGVVYTADGREAARLTLIQTGGGTQVKTVDGEPVEVVHETGQVWHVRLLSIDPMVPDKLEEAADFGEASQIGEAYAAKLAQLVAQAAAALDS